ncbi:MAG: CHAP domain-containing protein [Inquilinus sp.]|uniref:CHAP domain-containing protein n=1 Tax=Inquilinus sp. TaxID=1932117 RepID=UPI003F2C9F6F
MRRRDLLAGAGGALAGMEQLGRTVPAWAVPEGIGVLPPLDFFSEGQPVPTTDEMFRGTRGIRPPTDDEYKLATKILDGSPKTPRTTKPSDVAQYFEQLRNGEFSDTFGADSYLYATEWPVRANPVIVSFFDSTRLRTPRGDQTAWCAAFVNWCIMRAREDVSDRDGLLPETRSAAAYSFRDWGQETTSPLEGDLVCFGHRRHSDRGHVGFYVGRTDSGVYCLGGNQMPMRAKLADGTYDVVNTGEINTKLFPFRGRDLEFISFRTDPSLH